MFSLMKNKRFPDTNLQTCVHFYLSLKTIQKKGGRFFHIFLHNQVIFIRKSSVFILCTFKGLILLHMIKRLSIFLLYLIYCKVKRTNINFYSFFLFKLSSLNRSLKWSRNGTSTSNSLFPKPTFFSIGLGISLKNNTYVCRKKNMQ